MSGVSANKNRGSISSALRIEKSGGNGSSLSHDNNGNNCSGNGNVVVQQVSLFKGYERTNTQPVRPLNGDALDVRFPLLKHETNSQLDWGWETGLNSKMNVGEFYTSIYKGLYHNGHVPVNHDYIIKMGDETRVFKPDLDTKGLFGRDFTEIKSRFEISSGQPCRQNQVENYSFMFLKRLEEHEDIRPSVNYAFFMYGNGSHAPLKLHMFDSETAMSTIAGKTKELVIMPMNMALLTFKMSRTERRVRKDVGEEEFFIVAGHLLRRLHEGTTNMWDLIDDHAKRHDFNTYSVKKFAEKMHLDAGNVAVTKKSSEDIRELRFGDKIVTPFSITAYALRDPDAWNKSYLKNHSKILSNLGLDDLYSKYRKGRSDDIPF